MEHIENTYRKEELAKREAPPRRVWKSLKRNQKFKRSHRTLYIVVLVLIILTPLTCSVFRKWKTQLKRIHPKENTLKTESVQNAFSFKPNGASERQDNKTELSHTEISLNHGNAVTDVKEIVVSHQEKVDDRSNSPHYSDELLRKTKYKPVNRMSENQAVAEAVSTVYQNVENEDLWEMCSLESSIDRLQKPELVQPKDSLTKSSSHRKPAIYVGYAFAKRRYDFVSEIDSLNSAPVHEWQQGIAAGVRIPIGSRWSMELGVELLKCKASTNQSVNSYHTEEFITYLGTLTNPFTGDTISLYDTTTVVSQINRTVNTPVKINTLNIPLRFGYAFKKGRFGVEAALGLCYQMSKFHLSSAPGDGIPPPFDGSAPLSLHAMYVTGDLRVSYLLAEHLDIYFRTSCRGLIFEKSDYINSTSSPGYGLFSGGISYRF